MTPKILLADDHNIVRKGIRFHCQEFGFWDVDDVADCAELMAALKEKKYTHLILDLALPDGLSLEILPNIRNLYPDVNICIFSMQSKDLYERALQTYGIPQFISKNDPEKDTIRLLKHFLSCPFSMREVVAPKGTMGQGKLLTPRETEVLYYILQEMPLVEIAKHLNLSLSSIHTYKERMYEKTCTNSIPQLRAWGRLYCNTLPE